METMMKPTNYCICITRDHRSRWYS